MFGRSAIVDVTWERDLDLKTGNESSKRFDFSFPAL